MELSDAERWVLDAVDTERMVGELRDLIRLPSVTGTAAESDTQHRVASKLTELGHDVDLWEVDLPSLRADAAYPGEEAPRSDAWGLVGTSPDRGQDGPTLVLCGHVDVVPPGDLAKWPSGDPFDAAADATTVYGRGACDMKAGLVAALEAPSSAPPPPAHRSAPRCSVVRCRRPGRGCAAGSPCTAW